MSAHPAKPRVVGKDYLQSFLPAILERGALSADLIESLLFHETLHERGIIVQASSGSTGQPLLIPRAESDIADIVRRVCTPILERFGRMPERIALVGGISHVQAATKLKSNVAALASFGPDQLQALASYDPVLLSCYPSIMRELLVRVGQLPSLRAIKLGGERVFSADLRKIFKRFGDILVIEQYGSTEMPAVALRVHRPSGSSPYILQRERFSFLLNDGDGWQPLVVRDNFPAQLFPIGEFYDMGDDIRISDGQVVEVRRRGDPAADFYPDFERMLGSLGVVNVQVERSTLRVRVDGTLDPGTAKLGDDALTLADQPPRRIAPSNKMPLLV